MTNGQFYGYNEDRLTDAFHCSGLDCDDCRICRRSAFVKGIPGLANKDCWERFAALEYGIPLDSRIQVGVEKDPNPL